MRLYYNQRLLHADANTKRREARALHISESALHSKLQGQTQFKLNEAENLSAMLGMTMSERDACFFDTQNRYERSLAAAERRKPK